MNKKIIFKIGEESRPIIEDLSNNQIKNSIFFDQYQKALLELERYLVDNESTKSSNSNERQRINKGNDVIYQNDNFNNIFAFIGDRGAGKTSLTALAVGVSQSNQNCRYIEARIAPAKNGIALAQTINFLDADMAKFGIKKDSYFYILHFIKSNDSKKNNLNNSICFLERNHKCRENISGQAKAITKVLSSSKRLARRIVGVDAASSEIEVRPEAFGQVYRYLKHTTSLGFTYHVGEDFMDVVDGLRAIDEAVLFLNLSAGDRMGHALALEKDYACGNTPRDIYRWVDMVRGDAGDLKFG